MRITFDVYTMTTVDNVATEAILHYDVTGEIEADKSMLKENSGNASLLTIWVFFPDID